MSKLADALKEKRWVIFVLGLLLVNSMGVIIFKFIVLTLLKGDVGAYEQK